MHYGGWILPGISLMRNSLIENTARLDIPDDGIKSSGIGLNTFSAIEEGCLLAQTGALMGALEFAKIEINLYLVFGLTADMQILS